MAERVALVRQLLLNLHPERVRVRRAIEGDIDVLGQANWLQDLTRTLQMESAHGDVKVHLEWGRRANI